jgi:hypothetical protein
LLSHNYYGAIFKEDGSIKIIIKIYFILLCHNCYGAIFKKDGSIAIIIKKYFTSYFTATCFGSIETSRNM